jgi:hypothetical protein
MPAACIEQKTKKYRSRGSPPYSAMDCKGSSKKGNDGGTYVSKPDKRGIYRWVKGVGAAVGTPKNKTIKRKSGSKSAPKNKIIVLDMKEYDAKHKGDDGDDGDDGADGWMKSAEIKSPIEGMISKDGRVYIKNKWVAASSDKAILNGFKKFTVDYAAKHINKPVILYTREYSSKWPARNAWTKAAGNADNTYSRMKFIPNGDAGIMGTKKKFVNWLTTRSPPIKEGTHFYVDGETFFCNNKAQRASPYDCNPDEFLADGLQVDSKDKQTLSTNLMNTEVFVKA